MTTLRKKAAFVALATTLTVAASTPVLAQASNCAARDTIIAKLAKAYAEQPVSLGVTAQGGLLEVLASPDGTWTILVTLPNGPTCLVSHGDGWSEREPVADGPLA